jgi:hypothetical protein
MTCTSVNRPRCTAFVAGQRRLWNFSAKEWRRFQQILDDHRVLASIDNAMAELGDTSSPS